MKKLQLAYRQSGRDLGITRSQRAFTNVVDLHSRQHVRQSPEQVLEALLGRVSPLSATLGLHPNSQKKHHPTHERILRELIRRTGGPLVGDVAQLAVSAFEENAVVVGGPIASRHAAAIFGTPSSPSVLGVDLPVTYDLSGVVRSSSAPEKRARLIVEGRTSTAECFVLTSLPMQDRRLINVSALTTAGGDAVDLVLGDEQIIHDLHIRTRSLKNAGWQALFRVHVKNGEPFKVDRKFELFTIAGINFDAADFALNDPEFLHKYADGEELTKIERRTGVGYTGNVTTDPELDELTEKLKTYLKQKPQNAALLRYRIESTLGEFSAAAAPIATVRTDRPKWSDKTARKGRNPVQFIQEEYQVELDAGTLTRPVLKAVDHLLYNAYAAWISPSRHPEDDLKLPKKSDEVSRELAEQDPVAMSRYARLGSVVRMRRHRSISNK